MSSTNKSRSVRSWSFYLATLSLFTLCFAGLATGQTFPGAGTGAIPDGGPGCGPSGPDLDITFTVAGLPAGAPGGVEVDMDATHSWVGDLKTSLIAPDGTTHILFSDTGSTTATACGSSDNLAGVYEFSNDGADDWWAQPNPYPVGDYQTTTAGDVAGGGAPTDMDAAFAGIADQNGTWILRVIDAGGGDTGSINAANLTLINSVVAQPANVDVDGDGTTDYTNIRDTSPAASRGEGNPMFAAKSVRERLKLQRDMETNRTDNVGGPPPPGTGITWYAYMSGDMSHDIVDFGEPASDFVAPADYDGDGKADLTLWRPIGTGSPSGNGFFFSLQSTDSTINTVDFGQTGDDPTVSGDYDGDGEADFAVFRCPSVAGQCTYFYIGSAGGGETTFVPWGNGTPFTLFPNPGDFDGDGKYDFNVQRTNPDVPGAGQFVLLRSSDGGVEYINWGLNTDLIVPGDYDGDGKSDIAIARNQGGQRTWYIMERDGDIQYGIPFGLGTDFTTPGDYDGDGKQDIAVWRASDEFYYVLRSSDGDVSEFEWGLAGDYPVTNWQVH